MTEEDIKNLEKLAKDPNRRWKYIQVCKELAENHPEVLQYIDTNIDQKDYEKIFRVAAVHETAINYVPKDIEIYKNLCIIAAYTNGMSIQYMSPELEYYDRLARDAVGSNGMALQFIKEEDYKEPDDKPEFFRTTFSDLQKKALERSNGEALQLIPRDAQDYEEKCMYALDCSDGLALQHIPRDIDNYEEYCRKAVRLNGMALEFVPKDIENYEELCRIAVSKDGEAIQFISKEDVKSYEELEDIALATTPTALQFIPRYQNDLEKIVEITENSPHAFQYASPEIRGNIDAVVRVMNNCKTRHQLIVRFFEGNTDPIKLVELADRTEHTPRHLATYIDYTAFDTYEERKAFEASLPAAQKQYEKEKERRELLKEANELQLRLNEIKERLNQIESRDGGAIGES